MKKHGKMILLSGEIGSGKTRLCRQIKTKYQIIGWDVAGIISPAVLKGGVKIAIECLDLRSGEQRLLAELSAPSSSLQGPQTNRWQFSSEALNWCNLVLDQATPCDLLIIDELGPLEFDWGGGMQAGFRANDSRNFIASITIVRTALVGKALNRWPDAEVINITNEPNASQLIKNRLQKIASNKHNFSGLTSPDVKQS